MIKLLNLAGIGESKSYFISQFTLNIILKCYSIGNVIQTNNNYVYSVLLRVKYFHTSLNLFCKNCMINLVLGTIKVIIYSEMDQNNCMTICLKKSWTQSYTF